MADANPALPTGISRVLCLSGILGLETPGLAYTRLQGRQMRSGKAPLTLNLWVCDELAANTTCHLGDRGGEMVSGAVLAGRASSPTLSNSVAPQTPEVSPLRPQTFMTGRPRRLGRPQKDPSPFHKVERRSCRLTGPPTDARTCQRDRAHRPCASSGPYFLCPYCTVRGPPYLSRRPHERVSFHSAVRFGAQSPYCQSRLVLSHDLPAVSRGQRSPRDHVDSLRHKAHRTICQHCIDTTRMIAARGNHGIR